MDYSEFVRKVVAQDKRNIFSSYDGELEDIPFELKNFYLTNNPAYVEVGYNGTSIHFVSVENLESVNKTYKSMSVGFVFATSDGDPIFLSDGNVYTSPHGVKNPEWEKITETFDSYLSMIVAD